MTPFCDTFFFILPVIVSGSTCMRSGFQMVLGNEMAFTDSLFYLSNNEQVSRSPRPGRLLVRSFACDWPVFVFRFSLCSSTAPVHNLTVHLFPVLFSASPRLLLLVFLIWIIVSTIFWFSYFLRHWSSRLGALKNTVLCVCDCGIKLCTLCGQEYADA